MVVKDKIFKAEYPKDKSVLKEIISEYDSKLEKKLSSTGAKESAMILYIIGILMSVYVLFMKQSVSVFIRAIYIIPVVYSSIYNIVLDKKVKEENYQNQKQFYKSTLTKVIFILLVINLGTLFLQMYLFSDWKNTDYLVVLLLLLISTSISIIYWLRISPERFIRKHQNKDIKENIVKPITAATPLLMLYINYAKPYFLLMIVGYMFLVIISGAFMYDIFVYMQYDKIQKLKEDRDLFE